MSSELLHFFLRPRANRLCHNYFRQKTALLRLACNGLFLNFRVTPLRKLALKMPVLNYDTASKYGVFKANNEPLSSKLSYCQ
jgi:hypothetical protein